MVLKAIEKEVAFTNGSCDACSPIAKTALAKYHSHTKAPQGSEDNTSILIDMNE
jgi:hypothetical protein